MLDKLKEKLIEQLKTVSKDGIKMGNIEYIAKLAETYKNLNKAEKEELESLMLDEKIDGGENMDRYSDNRYRTDRYMDDRYMDDRNRDERYGARGRGPHARRDSRGRYADGPIMPLEETYYDYMDTKRRYRASGTDKEGMHTGLDMVMKYMVQFVEDLYHDCDSEEERRIMDKHLRKLQELH